MLENHVAQRLAWYSAQSSSRQFAAEALFGKVLDVRAVINDDSRNGYKTTHTWLFANGQYLHPLIQGSESGKRKIWWSAPPFWQGGNWDDAASGAYDADWQAMLQGIVSVEAANGNASGTIDFRPAFEFNGNWFHWSVGTKVAQFIAAWRRMWNVAQAVAPGRFLFEYAPSETSQYTGAYADPNACWPGNQYVAKIGLDLYWKPFASWGQWGTNPDSAYTSALNSPLGLNWLVSFAASKGNKPIVLSEWGVQGGSSTASETINTEPYVRKTAEFCRLHDIDLLYWNGTASEGYLGDVVSHNNWPVTRAAIAANFVAYADNGGGTETPPGDTGGTPGGTETVLWVDARTHPEDALYWSNQRAYGLRDSTDVTALRTGLREIEATTYWSAVASNWRTDALYTGPTYAVGDISQAEALQAEAETQRDAALSSLSAAQQHVTSLSAELASAQALIAALQGSAGSPATLAAASAQFSTTASSVACTIDESGIRAPTYQEILDALRASYRLIYGADVYLEDDSQDGQMLAIFARAVHDSNNAAIAVWNSFSPATAQGSGLSSVVRVNGITRAAASRSSVDLLITGTVGATITNGVASDTAGNRWLLPASVTIPSGASLTVTATAENLGAVEAPSGSITQIATPTRGWVSVTNAAAATPGAPVETDAGLRIRQARSVALPSLTVLDGIVGAVAAVPGVTRYAVRENDTNSTDANGLPAHSIAFVVEGGDSTTIARAIATKKAPGVYTHGSGAINVPDSRGAARLIRFSRPLARPIAVAVTIQALDGYVAATGTQIRQAVAGYINGLGLGADVLIARLYLPAQLYGGSASGTYELVEVRVAIKPGTPAASDVTIAYNQVATCDAADVTLTVSP